MSRLVNYLNEKWITLPYGDKFEVLENPSTKEIRKLVDGDDIRFTLHKSDLYVWDADNGVHARVWIKLGKPKDEYYSTAVITALHGVAKFKGGKYVMYISDDIQAYLRNGFAKNPYDEPDLKRVYNLFKDNRIIDIKPYFKYVIKRLEDRG